MKNIVGHLLFAAVIYDNDLLPLCYHKVVDVDVDVDGNEVNELIVSSFLLQMFM